MANLKELKNRIGSVKNTQKITKAMKMVAAAKLRRAQEQAEAARPYAERMQHVVSNLAAGAGIGDSVPVLLRGTGGDTNHLLVVATADRGLAGAFNSSIIRSARAKIEALQAEGKHVQIYCIGRKGYEFFKRSHKHLILGRSAEIGRSGLDYDVADTIGEDVLALFKEHKIDVVTLVFNRFKSAISQEVTWQQLIPLPKAANDNADAEATQYEYEPSEEEILADLLPRNLAVQIFRGLLENTASEHGARMTAMDNATRNAGDMIDKLSLVYNRTRQAAITTELTEIISGAEAV